MPPTPYDLVKTYAREFFEDNENECYCEISTDYLPFHKVNMDGLYVLATGPTIAFVHMDRLKQNPNAVIHASYAEDMPMLGGLLLKLLGSSANSLDNYKFSMKDGTWTITVATPNPTPLNDWTTPVEPAQFALQAHSKPEPEPLSAWDWVVSNVEKMIENCQVEADFHVPENFRLKLMFSRHPQIELSHVPGNCITIKICKAKGYQEPDYYGQLLHAYRERMTSTELQACKDLMDEFIRDGSFSSDSHQRFRGLTQLCRAYIEDFYGVIIGCPHGALVNIQAMPGGVAYHRIIDYGREKIEQRDLAFIRMMEPAVVDAVAAQTISE